MLGLDQESDSIADAWENVAFAPQLPAAMKDFLDEFRAMSSRHGCRRAYNRFCLRGKAIMCRMSNVYGVYTVDASRQGIRFLSPVQLELKEHCRIQLPKTKEFQIEIMRCNRINDQCYDCGAQFVLGAASS